MDDPVIVHGGRKLKIVLILGFFCPIYVIGNCLKKQAGSWALDRKVFSRMSYKLTGTSEPWQLYEIFGGLD